MTNGDMVRANPWNPLWSLTIIWAAGLLWSGWRPYERQTWWMEVAPALIALPVLWATTSRFRFTSLAIWLITAHGIILMIGGAYTYALVPFGFDLQAMLDLARNPYDRIGHLAQGFVPAIVVRELLIRQGKLAPGKLTTFLVIAVCLAISATYELIEFGAAIWLGEGADAFLGTQGDPWDTQWDMLMCLTGAVLSLMLLSRMHDRQIAKTEDSST